MSSRNVVDLRTKRAPARARSTAPTQRPVREQKRLPLRARRRRVRVAYWFGGFLVVCGIAYGVHWVSYLPQFNITNVVVIGTQRFPPELIKAYAETELYDGSYRYISHSSVFFFRREQMERSIAANFPRIKAVHISRDTSLSTTMRIAVTERAPFARWCRSDAFAASTTIADQSCYQMDDTGYVFADANEPGTPPSAYAEPYVFSGDITSEPIGSSFIAGHLPGLLVLLTALSQQADLTPIAVHIENAQDFSVLLQEGFTLKASFGQDAGTLARNLKLVLHSDSLIGHEKDLQYIDLRFGNKAYFKLIGSK